MKEVYLLLGSNLGDRRKLLEQSTAMVQERIGGIKKKSLLYVTQPWGFEAEVPFLNQVLLVETEKNPHEILHAIFEIETALGRHRGGARYASRSIDIDILLFGDLVVHDTELQIPHPRMHLRNFTLVPLAEIAGQEVHPILKKDINHIYRLCKDEMEVTVYNENS